MRRSVAIEHTPCLPFALRLGECRAVVNSAARFSGFQPALVQEAAARTDVDLIDLRAMLAPIDGQAVK
ncbi:MAG: hypothetical protein ACOC1F_08205 [Myxococcota bacterium]